MGGGAEEESQRQFYIAIPEPVFQPLCGSTRGHYLYWLLTALKSFTQRSKCFGHVTAASYLLGPLLVDLNVKVKVDLSLRTLQALPAVFVQIQW